MFIITILAPVGVSSIYDVNRPNIKQTTDKIADEIVTDLNDLKTLIEIRAGNSMSDEINIEPINLIPKTIVIAVRIAMRIL